MTDFKKFSKGRHTYTKFGPNFKEVRVEGGQTGETPPQPQTPVSIDVDDETAQGVYSNTVVLHQSPEELVLDFTFLPPGQTRGRVRSRVVLPYKNAAELAKMLKKACEDQHGH